MIEVIMEMIGYLFVEIIFEGIILRLLRAIRFMGLIILKLITLSNKSTKEFRELYKDSSKPYFLGFGMIIGIIYMLVKLIG